MASNRLLSFATLLAKTPKHALTRHCRTFSSASHALNVQQTNQTELKNGIRVATEGLSSPTASVGVLIDCGSRYESEQTSGVSALTLHTLLKRQNLETDLNRIGAVLKSDVGRDRMSLSIRCLSSDVPKAIEILGSIISNPKLEENEVQNQRKQVLREMEELDANYESVTMTSLHAMAYQNTPLALPVIGRSETVSALSRNDLQNYINSHFKGPRIVVTAAGEVNHNAIVESVDRHFGQIKASYDSSDVPVLKNCRYTGSDIRIRDDAMPVAHIAMAIEGAGYDNPDHIPLSLATSLVGNWDRTYGGGADVSSYLGLCSAADNLSHSFRSFNHVYKETGLWGIYLVTERMKQEDVIWHLTYEWKRFCTELTDNELNRGKNIFLTELMRQNEGAFNVSQTIANEVLNYGRRIPLDEWRSRVLSISANEVRKVCNEYIWDRCPVVAAVGPIEQLEDYEILRGKFYWFRY